MNRFECQNSGVRAGRLVSLMLILQRRGRATAAHLADELEVSQRTILRDIEELSGAGVARTLQPFPRARYRLLTHGGSTA